MMLNFDTSAVAMITSGPLLRFLMDVGGRCVFVCVGRWVGEERVCISTEASNVLELVDVCPTPFAQRCLK